MAYGTKRVNPQTAGVSALLGSRFAAQRCGHLLALRTQRLLSARDPHPTLILKARRDDDRKEEHQGETMVEIQFRLFEIATLIVFIARTICLVHTSNLK